MPHKPPTEHHKLNASIPVFTALRTYALCTNWIIAAMILFLHGASIGVNVVIQYFYAEKDGTLTLETQTHLTFKIEEVNSPLIGCLQSGSTPVNLAKL